MKYQYPDSYVFYRRLNRKYRKAVSSKGIFIFDEEGKRYLDASGGAVVVNIGHGVSEIGEAVARQISELAYVNGTQFTSDPVENLANELAEVLPGDLKYSYYLASGSEAIEAAVKLARQFWVEKGRTSKWKVICRTPSYHGNTLTALSLSGREHYRKIFGPLLTDFPRIAAPDSYRHPGCDACTGEVLEREILRQGADTIAAFIAEPIIGSSAGAVVPSTEYYRRIMETCRKHDVLFIADEVMAGMGRTGKWFSFQHFDFVPDILVLGKGINGGVVPLSAVVSSRKILDAIFQGSGYFNHAQTYSHTPVVTAAGLATIRYIKKNHLVERAAEIGAILGESLAQMKKYPCVGDVRGKGLMWAVEFVKDQKTKEPFSRSEKWVEKFTDKAFDAGLIVWPNVGHVDGANGDLVMVSPPFTITADEVGELISLFKQTVEQML